MRRTYRTLNGCEMQCNAEVGLFTKPSIFNLQYSLLLARLFAQSTKIEPQIKKTKTDYN